MRLDIDDQWSVDCDGTCCTLIHKKVITGDNARGIKAKPENIGKTRDEVCGFYGTIQQALNGYLQKSIQASTAVFTIPQLISAIEKAEETIKKVVIPK